MSYLLSCTAQMPLGSSAFQILSARTHFSVRTCPETCSETWFDAEICLCSLVCPYSRTCPFAGTFHKTELALLSEHTLVPKHALIYEHAPVSEHALIASACPLCMFNTWYELNWCWTCNFHLYNLRSKRANLYKMKWKDKRSHFKAVVICYAQRPVLTV